MCMHTVCLLCVAAHLFLRAHTTWASPPGPGPSPTPPCGQGFWSEPRPPFVEWRTSRGGTQWHPTGWHQTPCGSLVTYDEYYNQLIVISGLPPEVVDTRAYYWATEPDGVLVDFAGTFEFWIPWAPNTITVYECEYDVVRSETLKPASKSDLQALFLGREGWELGECITIVYSPLVVRR